MNRSHTFFWCFHCWLWASKCRFGRNQPRNLLPELHFIKKLTRNKNNNFLHPQKYINIFFASPIRVHEFITKRNKNENKKIAVNLCTFLNPNSTVLNLTKKLQNFDENTYGGVPCRSNSMLKTLIRQIHFKGDQHRRFLRNFPKLIRAVSFHFLLTDSNLDEKNLHFYKSKTAFLENAIEKNHVHSLSETTKNLPSLLYKLLIINHMSLNIAVHSIQVYYCLRSEAVTRGVL